MISKQIESVISVLEKAEAWGIKDVGINAFTHITITDEKKADAYCYL